MEMGDGTKPADYQLEEDVMASQVLEIICGFGTEKFQNPEPEEIDVCSVEEGDDSVFYSDEDQTREHIKANRSGGTGRCRRLYNSEAAGVDAHPSERNEGAVQALWTEAEEAGKESRALETEQRCPKLETHESSSELNCKLEDSVSSDDEEQGQAPAVQPLHVESVSNQLGSGSESEAASDINDPDLPPLEPVPGFSTLTLPKKSPNNLGHQKSFNHLMASKYSSVSYRKIRRGNTRQKIEEFEYIMMNL